MLTKETKKLDKLWSEKVKSKAGYRCESCKIVFKSVMACHVVGRRHRGTRWGCWIDDKYDLCGWCGCFSCHNQYDEHGIKEPYIKRVVIGKERYDKIQKKAKRLAKYMDYEEVRGWLNDII